MPKEKISDDLGTFDVTVGWATGYDMQVGIEIPNGTPIIRRLYGDAESAEAIGKAVVLAIAEAKVTANPTGPTHAEVGRAVIEAIVQAVSSPDGPYRGLYATLDRGAANRLIRSVRKARDAAYGRDE